MNSPFHLFITAGASALVGPLLAIEAPPDNAPPPAIEGQAAAKEGAPADPPAAAVEPARPAAAFLGVATGPLPEMLATHLRLEPDHGVVIRNVVPGGPAASGGITEHDVVTKVAGHPVGSPEELRELTQALEPGEEIEVEVIHQGETVVRNVVLGSRDAALADVPQDFNKLLLEGFPQDQAQRIREAIARHLQEGEPGPGAVVPLPPMADVMREMQERMEKVLENGGIDLVPGEAQFRADATVRVRDEEGSIEMKSHDESKELTVRDPAGEIVWSGPWDTEQDKAAAPDHIRERIEKLNIDTNFKGKGLRFNLKWPRHDEPELAE